MKLDTRTGLARAALAAAFAVMLVQPAARAQPDFDEPRAVSSEQALLADASAYAEGFGVTIDEALHRVAVIEAVDAAASLLASDLDPRFAGGWFEHTPSFRAVLRFEGVDPISPSTLAAIPRLREVVFELGADHSFADLVTAQTRLAPMLATRYPEMGSWIDVRLSGIALAGPYDLSASAETELGLLAGLPITFRKESPPKPEHTYGGKNITVSPQACTTAFTVKDQVSGLMGVMTAGHCVDPGVTSATYYQTDSISYGMTLGGKRWDANQDFAWFQSSAHAYYAQFWDGSNLRTQTSVKSRSTMESLPVCHFGRSTGYSCGVVVTVWLNPGLTYCNGGPCDGVWGMVADAGGYNIKCGSGDSGGPYFWINAAWGLHSGGHHTGAPGDDCDYTVMFTAGGLEWDGVNTRIWLP